VAKNKNTVSDCYWAISIEGVGRRGFFADRESACRWAMLTYGCNTVELARSSRKPGVKWEAVSHSWVHPALLRALSERV